MNIQTISIVVPTKGCVNKCPFCVSRMHDNKYENNFNKFEIKKRIKWAISNDINTCIITGTGEAFQNYHFLGRLADLFEEMNHPFPNVEFQTTGVMLMDKSIDNIYYGVEILKELGVNTISLSVSDIFNSVNNWNIIDAPEKFKVSLSSLCSFIKDNDFNLRLSLNMTNIYNNKSPEQILRTCKSLRADQITFRKMYHSDDDSSETIWVKNNSCDNDLFIEIKNYIEGTDIKKGQGEFLYLLPFGGKVYSIDGMSTAIDDDCMSKSSVESLKYVILRENGKIYCRWDDSGSLIF